MSRDYDNDRPKRSWKEIDQAKDGTRHRQADNRQLPKHKQASADSASKVYKSKLDSFFDGDEDAKIPANARKLIGSLKDTSDEGKNRLKALNAIKEAGTSSAADKAVAAYLKKWELPLDYALLGQVLMCDDEEYVEQALETLEEMFAGKQVPKRTEVLEQRLRRVKNLADDEELQDRAGELIRGLRLFS
jgi:uncharacterized protein (UPF0147 family)